MVTSCSLVGVDKQKKTPRTRDGNDNASSSHPAAFAQSPRKSSTVPMFYVFARSPKEGRGGRRKSREISPRPTCLRNATIFPSSPLPSTIFCRPSPFWSLNREDPKRLLSNVDLHSKHGDSTRKSESISALFRDPERRINGVGCIY